MTDQSEIQAKGSSSSTSRIAAGLAKRHRSERFFRRIGLGAIIVALCMLATLIVSIVGKGYTAFVQTRMAFDVTFSESVIDPSGARDPEVLRNASYGTLVRNSLRKEFPDVKNRKQLRTLFGMVSKGTTKQLRVMVMENPDLIGKTVTVQMVASDDMDMLRKG